MIARVAVDVSTGREFDYRVPAHLEGVLQAGSQVKVPFGRRVAQGYVMGFKDSSDFAELKEIQSMVGEKPILDPEVMRLAEWMADYYAAPIEQVLKTVIPGAVRRPTAGFKQQLHVVATPEAADATVLPALQKRAAKQARCLEILLASEGMLLTELVQAADASSAAVKSLEEKGYVKISKEVIGRDPHKTDELIPSLPHELTAEQAECYERMKRSIDFHDPAVVLLFGVTGSGKTEVYLQSIQYAMDQGKGAIVLVPEISLTPQTVERFRGRFGDVVGVLHSHLSDGERHDEWHRIHSGEATIVVGARSALFAPVKNLGLIVVDEEHEPSYKQEETPRYNARDVAVMRGHMQKCAVLLGSATPSIESYCNALSGKYQSVPLTERVDDQKMPVMQVVDMRNEKGPKGEISFFSRALIEGLGNRLARKEQSILFLNRRGYATTLMCPDCGEVAECDHCSVSLTYHKKRNRLQCHICGEERKVPDRCPNSECKSPQYKYSGMGTEKVEERIKKIFPNARVQRVDSDIMTTKHAYRRILGDFRTGKIDIMIGTQMIAKGLHFPNVTLVGVVFADTTLHMPDFRASERAFQLLTQVAGRAGRGDVIGEVIVQTHTPVHPAIQSARRLDYEGFVDEEMEMRKMLQYPPYTHMVCITFRGALEEEVLLTGEQFLKMFKPMLDERVVVSEICPAPLARMKGMYRYQFLMRSIRTVDMTRPLKVAVGQFKWPKKIRVTLDVDPVSLM